MSIENLKKILESDIEEIKSYHGCLTGDCPHNNSTDCCLELMNQVHESATNRLLPLLQKAVELAEYVIKHSVEEDYNNIKAREFLTEFTKMTEIKKDTSE